MSDVNAALAAAGASGRNAYARRQNDHDTPWSEVQANECLTLAVLKSLGLWDGVSWEWEVRATEVPRNATYRVLPVEYQTDHEGDALMCAANWRQAETLSDIRVVRRPKITSPQWEDVDD